MIEFSKFIYFLFRFVSDNHSVGIQQVVDCGSFCQKLGVAGDDVLFDILLYRHFLDDFSDHLCSANWNS